MRMTLKEMAWFADGHNKREREEWRKSITLVHLEATLNRVPRNKKLPPLEKLIPKVRVKVDAATKGHVFRTWMDLFARPGEIEYVKKSKKKAT